ncbi:MAG: type II toxin-antitoxin system RelE/ParE family toxin, partial [Bacteroidetes bacterium]
KILIRLQRIEENGNFGDYKSVGEGILELRIHFAKGYRVYLKEKDSQLILLLIEGDKSTQNKDIEKAKQLWKEYNNK